MTCALRIIKPHVVDPSDSGRTLATKANRNFNDVWAEFSQVAKVLTQICGRIAALEGNAPVSVQQQAIAAQHGWEDLRVPLVGAQAGGLQDPNLVKVKDDGSGSTGVYAYAFDATLEEELFFVAQLPHSRKYGTDIRPHIHWMPTNTNTGSVSFGLEYIIVNVGETAGNTTIIDAQQAGGGVAYKHQVVDLPVIDGADMTLSAMIVGRVFRDAGGTLGTDSYNADAVLLEIDFHFVKNSLGSRAEYKK